MKKYTSRLKVVNKNGISKIIGSRRRYFIKVKCQCGTIKFVNQDDFKLGKINSCGCFKLEINIKKIKKFNETATKEQRGGYIHGEYKTQFLRIYKAINQRCKGKYKIKGIKNEWKSYQEFKNDMYKSYLIHIKKYKEKNTSIDRIDNKKNYCKENCRWATYKQQANNTSKNRFITYKGKTYTLTQWAEKFGIKRSTLSSRLNKQNKSFEDSIL